MHLQVVGHALGSADVRRRHALALGHGGEDGVEQTVGDPARGWVRRVAGRIPGRVLTAEAHLNTKGKTTKQLRLRVIPNPKIAKRPEHRYIEDINDVLTPLLPIYICN